MVGLGLFFWGTSIRSTLQYARHTITATIVNAHAEYVIGNMRSALRRGAGEAWKWHGGMLTTSRSTGLLMFLMTSSVMCEQVAA